ncbi:hypothetical protein CHS0354_028273 [Potamilus streckersoni]|uniref:Uncharacterized protein n=1 Tax=Potamilus streckersoni TaxID=2493646 RepID=A0AAE0VJ30_9BIVA|nr:hypothetical protein CHS0354_028273 [Potamilus streckersoni]
MARSTCGTVCFVVATILGPAVLVFLAISFSTDHWLDFTVNRKNIQEPSLTDPGDKLRRAKWTHTRHRGIFRECYPGNDTAFFELVQHSDDPVIDGYCYYVVLAIPKGTDGHSPEYFSRLHLTRCHLAFYVVALFFFLLAYLFGLVLCCRRLTWVANTAGFFAYLAGFSTAAAIAFFHGAEYLERNKITDEDPIKGQFYLNWGPYVQNNTDRSYGYSYILGWVGMVLAAITATFYCIAGCYISGERYEELEKTRPLEYMDRTYHMMVPPMAGYPIERGYPMVLEAPHMDYYGGYPRYDDRRVLPAISYPEPTYSWS